MNTFRDRIDSGLVTTLDDLRSLYKTTVKKYHPDLNGPEGPRVDFDSLKQDYADALRYLLTRLDLEAAGPDSGFPALPTKDSFLDEFRNLVARGFPVSVQAASKNRAYAVSIRLVSGYLAVKFSDPEFFSRVNRESRALKRHQPKIHWYVLQIFWNLGDWRVTGYDYYRRIFLRHLEFIRETLEDEGFATLVTLLEFLVENTPSAPTRGRKEKL